MPSADGMDQSSRVLIVQVDEDAMDANIVFEHYTGDYTPEYGDNDQLPSGNLLICCEFLPVSLSAPPPRDDAVSADWLEQLDVQEWRRRGDADEMFDVRVEELVRDTKLPAWRADVQGPLCDVGTCEDSFSTWKIYSVEREPRANPLARVAPRLTRLARRLLRATAHLGRAVLGQQAHVPDGEQLPAEQPRPGELLGQDARRRRNSRERELLVHAPLAADAGLR